MTRTIYMHALAATAACALMLAAAPSVAFHPGETHSGAVPQGPHRTACENQGRQGVDQAIEVDGTVHCEPVADPGDGGEEDPGPIR